jgi:hypothetical protein
MFYQSLTSDLFYSIEAMMWLLVLWCSRLVYRFPIDTNLFPLGFNRF